MAITEKYVTSAGAGTGDGSSLGNARSWANMIADINAGGTAGNRYNVSGAISRGASDTISGSGTVTSPVIIRGYLTTIGDGYQGRTNGNGPLISTNIPVITYSSTFKLLISGNFILVETISVSGAVNGTLMAATGTDCVFKSCIAANSGSSTNAIALGCTGNRTLSFGCDATLTGTPGSGSAAVSISSGGAKAIGGRFTAVSVPGVLMSNTTSLIDSTIYSTGTHGVSINNTGAQCLVAFNTIVSASSDGINIITGTTARQDIIGNMITDCTTNGLNMVSTSNAAFAAYNRYRGNGTAIANGGDWITATQYGDVTTGSATDYVNAAGNDYRLVATSPAIMAGFPPYSSIGALQPQRLVIASEDD